MPARTVESAIDEAERLGLEIWGVGKRTAGSWECSIRAVRIENDKKVFYHGLATGGTATDAAHNALVCPKLTNLLDTSKVIDASKIPRPAKRTEDFI